jgi:MFS family permease
MTNSTQKKTSLSILGITIWLIASFFFMYEFFLRTFIGSVAAEVIPDLHLNAETFSILGSAYYVAYAGMQLPVGLLADKFGVKKIMAFATLVCALATFFFAHSSHFTSAFISRILMGFGSSFAFVCLLVVVITWFPRKYFGTMAGISQFIGTMGPLIGGGPLIALIAAYHTNWRNALSVIALIGIVLFVLVVVIFKNKPRGKEATLIYLTTEKPLSMRLLILIKNKQVWFIALYSATIYVSIALLGAIWGTEYLQAKGLTQSHAADMVSISWLGYAIGCPLLGAVSDLTHRRKPVLIFCALLGLCSTSYLLYGMSNNSLWIYGILFFALGITASGQNVGFATISEQVNHTTRATALGLNNGTIMLTSAIIPPIASYFIYITAGSSKQLTPHDFLSGLSIMPIVCLIALFIAIFYIKETFCKPQRDTIMLQRN